MWTEILCVGAGSCLGGIARYLSTLIIPSAGAPDSFPWATFAVNVTGCFLLGLLFGLLDRGMSVPASVKLFLTVGFCGGFTTFSTFANESFLLLSSSQVLIGLLYAGLNVFAGIAAVYLGYLISSPV